MIQQTLFGETDTGRPLASRMRPRTLEEFAGQRHLLGEGKVLRQLIDGDRVPSMVFWGPPGVGKTTLARIIANRTKANFIDFSAVTSGIKEIKEVMQTAEANRRFGEQTILFVDEIHRFNKAQQDAFLPFVEKGSIILIGATTENPSFEINSALLSRCKVFVLHGLSAGELTELLRRALTDPRGFGGRRVELAEGMLEMIANFANGDARTALNTLEMVVLNGDILPDGSTVVPMETLEQCISKKSLLYDKHGEEHYNLISALHKSMRNSDPDAGGGGGPAVCGAPPGALCQRRCGPGRQPCAGDLRGGISGVPLFGYAGVYGTSDACGGVPFRRTQIQCAVQSLRDRKKGRSGNAGRAGAAGHPQRAHTFDERAALR